MVRSFITNLQNCYQISVIHRINSCCPFNRIWQNITTTGGQFVSKMDLRVYIQLIFLCVLNTVFTFSGIVLNTLVIASVLKSSQLRKKLCHYMIMVLSCSDLITVIANHPAILLYLISWLTDDHNLFLKVTIILRSGDVSFGLSFLVLLVMSMERYLGAYYPIFHRTSVTKSRLLSLLALMLIFYITLIAISTNGMVISRTIVLIILISTVFLPLVCFIIKLFKISREMKLKKSPEKRRTMNLKSISTCLLVVACLVILSISTSIYIVFDIVSENKHAANSRLSGVWTKTLYTMNCTFNSLIFFWKNKILRTGEMKILETLICRNRSLSKEQRKL